MIPILRDHQDEALEAQKIENEGIIHLPTGSGKTLIQAFSIDGSIPLAWDWINKDHPGEVPVFVTFAPRIILSNQLFSTIRLILLDKGIDAHYLIVHSGQTKGDNLKRSWTASQPYRELKSTTKTHVIKDEYRKAKAEGVPLIIFGTYDSAERITNAKIPIYMLNCDEAQYLVSREFNWIGREEENEDHPIEYFNAYRKYYYTATLKETASDRGLGMNNSNIFGKIIYVKTPLEMIHAGEILRPRIHLVNIPNSPDEATELDRDVNAIIESFREHTIHVNSGAKVLIIAKGSKHLNEICLHQKMKNFIRTRPNLKIFDISSAFEPRINGLVVKREYFLSQLQGLTDQDEALIIHIDILSEGIDVPGITGIMPMNSMGLSKFLQTLGRATRLHIIDREDLYAEEKKYDDLDLFVKPYAWILIPTYGEIGEDLRDGIEDTVYALRGHGFIAAEDVVIKDDKGVAMPQPIGGVNQTNSRAKSLLNVFIQVQHEIEKREEADALRVEEFENDQEIKNKNFEEIIEAIKLF